MIMDIDERFSRSRALVGDEAIAKLQAAKVAIFGIGGVGSYAVEALARAGVGSLDLIDSDKVAKSNINRQLIALESTLGKYKTEVAKQRVLDISPLAKVNAINKFFLPENADTFDFSSYDYVVDAVDTVAAKVELVRRCREVGTPIISCMGMGNKLCPEMIEVSDISKTSVCPLAKAMRTRLGKIGIRHLKVVYSKEPPVVACTEDDGKRVPTSISFVPSVAGLIMAGEVVKDLIK